MTVDISERIEELTGIFGPSGREAQVADYIKNALLELGAEVHEDPMGNVIGKIGTEGPKLLFAAHMDTIGLMVTAIDDKGYLSFTDVGWLDPAMIAHTFVRFENGAQAAVCIREEKIGKELKLKDLYLDLGVQSREEAEKLVSIGDMAVFLPHFHRNDSRILATYLDNRSGCGVLLSAAEKIRNPKNQVYLLFTVQEEIGTRGAAPGAYGIMPDAAFAVDVTDVNDVPGTKNQGTCALGKGAGIKILDSVAMSRPCVVFAMERIGKEKDIPCQRDILLGGGTDAGPMAQVGRGIPVGGVSIPCRYVHAPIEVCDTVDLKASADLIAAMAETEWKA